MTIETAPASAPAPRATRTIAVAIAIGAAVVALLFAAGVLGGIGTSGAKVLTTKGLDAMIADIEDEFGTTKIVELTLFDDYAIVEIPVAGGVRRTQSYHYDGDFEKFGGGSSRGADESEVLIDLTELDVPATLALLKTTPKAVGLPDDPVSSVTVRVSSAPDPTSGEIASSYVMVSTDYEESGYVRADLAGKVIDVDTATDDR